MFINCFLDVKTLMMVYEMFIVGFKALMMVYEMFIVGFQDF